MFQDIKPYVFDNAYNNNKTPDSSSNIVIVGKDGVCVSDNSELVLPTYSQLAGQDIQYRYLLSVSKEDFYLAQGENIKIPEGYIWEKAAIASRKSPRHRGFTLIVAYQIASWYHNNKFCGRCGNLMEHDHKERMLKCSCGNIVYPKICPGIITAVIDRQSDKILLTKYAGREFKGYALIAGFTEIGESIEGTVHREVMEEVGLKVKNVCFYKSQPWPYSDSLLMGFFCELDGSPEITLEEEELAVGHWFSRDEIQEEFTDFALTNEMICQFKNGKI